MLRRLATICLAVIGQFLRMLGFPIRPIGRDGKPIILPPPTKKERFSWALLFLFIGWTGARFVTSFVNLATAARAYDQLQAISVQASSFWAFLAGVAFTTVLLNPFAWLNGKRLVIGCMMFAAMLGYALQNVIAGVALMIVSLLAPQIVTFGHLSASAVLLGLLLNYSFAPLAMWIGGFVTIAVIATIIGAIFSFFVGIPVLLFRNILQFDNELTRYRHRSTGLANYIVRLMFWLSNQPLPKSPPDDSRGARFAAIEEIQRLHQRDPGSNMSFGHIGNALFLKTEKHILIMASTRSGKGVTLIVPHLLRYRGSAFVLDPKGENAKATGRRRAELNEEVHYLDPFGISGKPQSRFNPLARFTPENMEAESKALAAAMFVVERHDHWTDSGQQLLALIILYVYLSPEIPAEHKDLPTVRKVLLGSLQPALDEMLEFDEADGLLRDLAMSFLETPQNELGSIISTARRQTEILDNPFLIACLSAGGEAPEVDFTKWHGGTMSVFLCLSAPKFPTFNRWLRLVLTSALDEMTDTLNPPTRPVCFMLDELATLGHLQTVENAVGLAAGYGIQLVTVFQDVAQMRDLYKSRWASFIGNAGVRAMFNLDDYESAEYWSKFIGGRLVETHSRSQDTYGLSSAENVGEAVRPLLPPDKLMLDFAAGKMLVLAQGAHPIITGRVAYWNDKTLDGLWDDPRLPVKPSPNKLPPGPTQRGPTSRGPAPAGSPPSSNGGGPSDRQTAFATPIIAASMQKPPPQQPRPYIITSPYNSQFKQWASAPKPAEDNKMQEPKPAPRPASATPQPQPVGNATPTAPRSIDNPTAGNAVPAPRVPGGGTRTPNQPDDRTMPRDGRSESERAAAARYQAYKTHEARGTLGTYFAMYPDDPRKPGFLAAQRQQQNER